MLKILNLLPRIPTPMVDGGAIAVYYNLLNLKRQGVDVVVAAFESNRHPQDAAMMEAEFQLYSIPGDFQEYSGMSAFKNLFDARPYNLALRFDQDRFRDLLRQVHQDHSHFDVVQCDWVYMAPYVTLVRELWPNAKMVLRQHNAEYMIFGRMAEHETYLKNRLFLKLQTAKMKRYESKALGWFDHVIALTDVDRELFKSALADGSVDNSNITTLPVGVDLVRFARPPELPRNKTFLILGSMGWAPYVQALLWFLNHVWQDFHTFRPEYRLQIVGSNPPDEIRAFHGRFNVDVLGFVEDVLPVMHESAAMIVPLKSGSGMRVKIIEAMAAELPIITTSVGCEGIPIEHERDCLIGNTVDELHQAILDFTSLEDQGNRLSSNALRIAAEDFSWESISRNTVELYQNIVK
jgi:polysaccharide biosynthesis protein PslH